MPFMITKCMLRSSSAAAGHAPSQTGSGAGSATLAPEIAMKMNGNTAHSVADSVGSVSGKIKLDF